MNIMEEAENFGTLCNVYMQNSRRSFFYSSFRPAFRSSWITWCVLARTSVSKLAYEHNRHSYARSIDRSVIGWTVYFPLKPYHRRTTLNRQLGERSIGSEHLPIRLTLDCLSLQPLTMPEKLRLLRMLASYHGVFQQTDTKPSGQKMSLRENSFWGLCLQNLPYLQSGR